MLHRQPWRQCPLEEECGPSEEVPSDAFLSVYYSLMKEEGEAADAAAEHQACRAGHLLLNEGVLTCEEDVEGMHDEEGYTAFVDTASSPVAADVDIADTADVAETLVVPFCDRTALQANREQEVEARPFLDHCANQEEVDHVEEEALAADGAEVAHMTSNQEEGVDHHPLLLLEEPSCGAVVVRVLLDSHLLHKATWSREEEGGCRRAMESHRENKQVAAAGDLLAASLGGCFQMSWLMPATL